MKTILILCLTTLATGLLTSPAMAERYVASPTPQISADEAAAKVQQQYGGRILAVETQQKNGKTVYRIKILTRKGVVRVVRINAGSR